PATTPAGLYPLSLHDALPIFVVEVHAGGATGVARGANDLATLHLVTDAHLERRQVGIVGLHAKAVVHDQRLAVLAAIAGEDDDRSEEHTSVLQSRENLVCRLL